jgi:hypothetical protein
LFTTAKEIKNDLKFLTLILVQNGKNESGILVDESVIEIINNIEEE